jgi:HAMP domain-containing protein
MSLRVVPLEEKLAVLVSEIEAWRRANRSPGSDAQHRYEVLKAIAADVRARIELPRSNALGELERAITRMIESKEQHYDQTRMLHVANVLINKWHTVSQALEQFGEESNE